MNYEDEKQAALQNEALTEGELYSASMREYAGNVGSENTEQAWILTPFDTWERNPYYNGPPVRHPEDDSDCG